jgi:hypothetical protein
MYDDSLPQDVKIMRVMEERFLMARDLLAYKASSLPFNSFMGPAALPACWINPNLFYGK